MEIQVLVGFQALIRIVGQHDERCYQRSDPDHR